MTVLRSPVAPHLPLQAEWPTREQALSIVAALDRMTEGTNSELDRLTGLPDAQTVAQRSYMVFGFPELEAEALAGRMANVFMRPRTGTMRAPDAIPEVAAPDLSTGLTPGR
ncbi:hypothetical protein [Allomesorhizobium camelthorni]|uniref:Uncharacterized protein n=1 Tax=Allomesorhizobium camelthorni TaxID=475069 RepID=A0A6G4WKT2_9HYPH|nr:hypothetical protein [Mesorhizobium camelthorni]NGO54826.1 hypothetical protein [Mesorhizobium camelthorni]